MQHHPTHPSIIVPVPREFRFAQCAVYLNRSPREPLHEFTGQKIRKLIAVAGEDFLLEITSKRDLHLHIAVLNRPFCETEKTAIIRFVSEWFDLATDLNPFYTLAAGDALLAQLVSRYFGLRLIRIHHLFQALVWAILGQQINLAFAYTLFQRFVHRYGESMTFAGRTYWHFPQASRVASLRPQELQALQITTRKSEYLIDLARRVAAGALDKATLQQNPGTAKERLQQLRGVGPWTANYVLMRCLGDPSAFPADDIGLQNAVKNQLGLRQKPDRAHLQILAQGWGDWRAYATFYLYRSLL